MNRDELFGIAPKDPATKYKDQIREALAYNIEKNRPKDEFASARFAKHAREKGADFSRDEVEAPKTRADHNERTRRFLESRGYRVERVDYYDSRTKRNHDLLGFGDMLAMKAGEPPLIVQLTSDKNVSARVSKVQSLKTAAAWMATGGRILVIGWKRFDSEGGAISYAPIEREVLAA